MKLSNENLKKMEEKKINYNPKYSRWYYGLSEESVFQKRKYFSKSESINDCLNLWLWDKYEINKVLDLQKVNRCKNNRFCPNCKILDTAKFIHKFKEYYQELIPKDYKAYMLTLTIPSVNGEDLRAILDKLSKSFLKMMEKFSYDKDDKKSYVDRLMKIDGGIRVLEITYNSINGFHPHYHCVIVSKDNLSEEVLKKKIKARYSTKRQEYDYKSELDVQFGKLWSMIWHGDRLSKQNIDSIVYDPAQTYYADNKKVLEVDFVELDEDGIYEVFKYTFKDADVESYYVFKSLVLALENKKIRQGFGLFYNMQCENVEVGELQELELEIEENPTSLLTREISELITFYKDYKKISRFQPNINNYL